MKRLLRRSLIGILALVGGAIAVSEIWPGQVAKLMLTGLNASAGLQRSTVETSFGQVHYLEGGTGETVVFLHGIFARKEHWVDMSRQISGDYRVILLDLPGFGDNRRLDPAQYDYDQQARNVLEVLDEIGLGAFHIAANSMGAQIAGQLAVALPDRVQSVAFIGSPVGVTSPVRSDMERAISEGHLPLVVTSEADYADRMSWLFPSEPFLPRPIARAWSAAEVSDADINPVIWEAVKSSGGPPLEDLAPDLRQPSLIIWCRDDRIFHVSGADILANALPNSSVVMPDGCGHLPMLDRAAETGRELLGFLQSRT